MAVFTLQPGVVLGAPAVVENLGETLVSYAASNSSYNSSSAAPANFNSKINPETGKAYIFTPGFCMNKPGSGDGKWEGHYPSGSSYRLDLQGFTADGYANWQLQSNTSKSKTVAAVLMRCGGYFSQRHMLHALRESAKNSQICRID